MVSVIIATHNMGRFLPAAIASVLGQTYQNLEVLVVDDGSTDDTREAVTPFGADPRFRYLFQANAGQTAAKNAGASVARGRYIGFCDADDYWAPHKLEAQLSLFATGDHLGVVYSRSTDVDEHGDPLPSAPLKRLGRGRITDQLFRSNFIPFGSALVRTEAFRAARGFDSALRMGIDWDLWLRLSVHWDFDYVDEALYFYRIWPGQMSRNWEGRYSAALFIMRRFMDAHPNQLPRRSVSLAYAVTYANRARKRLSASDRTGAVGDSIRSIASAPTHSTGWRSLGRTLAVLLGVKAA